MTITGGLILCGGKSSRMGHDKGRLRFGQATLLERCLARMEEVAAPVVVALGAEAAAPPLPPGVLLTRDERPGQGPLWGLLEGFRALAGKAEQVLVMPVDMPFFTRQWMEMLVAGLEGRRACLFQWEGITNALTAAYRLELLPKLEGLVAEGRMRPMFISEGEPTRVIAVEDHWREGEGPPPLMDMDTPQAYREALLLEGIGTAGGAPVTVEIAGAAVLGRPEALSLPPVSLFAATGRDVLDWVGRLYPELGDSLETAAAGEALHAIDEAGARRPLGAGDRLIPGGRLLLDLGAPNDSPE